MDNSTKPQSIRSFIAAEIGNDLRDKLGKVIERLKKCNADVKWVKPGSIHLTLKFLGDVPPDDIPRLESAMKKAITLSQPFEVEAMGLGAFPNINRPRVVWAGLIETDGALKRLAKSVENKCAKRGYKPENKPFRPHLTLGRIRSPKGNERLKTELEALADIELGKFTVDAIVLFKSDLKPGGAVYTVQKKVAFPQNPES